MVKYKDSVVRFFKEEGLALSSVSDVELGVTYYSNSWRDGANGFTINRLLSDKEHWDVWSKSILSSGESMFPKSDEIAWFEIDGKDGRASWHSLTDCNIGACYNPWMIFRTKDALDAYNKLQVITHERDYLDDLLDDAYDYDYDDENS